MSRILIVDDEESIRVTFESFLSDEGHTVATSGDYDEALERIAKTGFDLVFADIILGDKNGIDVLRAVKEQDATCPVVMITGNPDIETAAEAVRLGAFDYIQKPVRQETLLRVTSAALKNKAIIEERERYRSNLEAIFRSVKDAIIMVDKELVVVEANDAAKKICGFSRETIGKPFSSEQLGCAGCLEALRETIGKRQAVDAYNLECRVKNRPRRIVSLTTSPLMDGKGVFSGAVLVVRDETRLDDLERRPHRRIFHGSHPVDDRGELIFGRDSREFLGA